MGASSEAVEAMTKVLGPSEMDPYAVQWEEQPLNILKGFIVFFPDMRGFDKSAADVSLWTKEQAVEECVRIQQFCPKAIDKPWAAIVQEALGDEAAEAGFEDWQWSLGDTQKLTRLVKAQDAIKERIRKRALAESPAGNTRRRSSSAPPRQPKRSAVLQAGNELLEDESAEDGMGEDDRAGSVRFKAARIPPAAPRKITKARAAADEISATDTDSEVPGRKAKERGSSRSRNKGKASAAKKKSGSEKILEEVRSMTKKKVKHGRRSRSGKKRRSRRSPSSSDSSTSVESGSSRSWITSSSDSSDSEDSDSEDSRSRRRRSRGRSSKGKRKASSSRGRKEKKKLKQQKERRRAGDNLQYQLHTLRNEVRGSKPEDASTIHELWAAWSALANVQSEVDEAAGRSVYGPKGLPRMMEEAKQQCLDDFRLASGLVPEGRGKLDVLRAAEKLIINTLVQESRKHLFVRKFEMFAMVEKATNKARDMLAKHVGRPGATSDGGQSHTAAAGKGSGGTGQGGGGQGKGKGGIKKCYACNQYGHMSYDCPTKQQAFGLGAPTPFTASPPYTQQQSLPQYRQPAGQQAGGSGKKDQ